MLSQQWTTVAPWIRKSLYNFSPIRLKAYGPSLVGWGVCAGFGASLLLESTPIFRNDVLSKIPWAGAYWKAPEE